MVYDCTRADDICALNLHYAIIMQNNPWSPRKQGEVIILLSLQNDEPNKCFDDYWYKYYKGLWWMKTLKLVPLISNSEYKFLF